MKIVGLDGRDYTWDLMGLSPLESEKSGSSGHQACRLLLNCLFPAERVLEEVFLPGSGGLRGDFYLPGRRIMVEVHGRQHYEFVLHFHGSYAGFLASKGRDNNKRDWCERNRIEYVDLPDTDHELWSERILEACRPRR